jgi:hypothetical protein
MVQKIFKAVAVAASFGLLAASISVSTPVYAHVAPAPCDFVTGGGFVFKDNGERINYGVHGGCKNGEFWGHVNFVDHQDGLHFNSTRITGYVWDPAMPNSRDICGWGRINTQEQEVMFRFRVVDNGEPGRTAPDMAGIMIDNWFSSGERFYRATLRDISGGNLQLHKGNKSNTLEPGFFSLQEWQMCGDMPTP